MKAVIMAGGEGSRLRPMTCTTPKPMVPLLNKPVINYCIELLKKHKITDICTTLYYLPEKIKEHIKDGEELGVNVTHFVSTFPLGTAGSVKQAAKDKDTYFIMSGDSITDCDITEAVEFHKNSGSKITIILKRVASPMEYGVVLMDKEHKITRFIEKPKRSEVFSDLANTGMYIIEPSVMDMIPSGTFDFSNDLFPMLMENNVPIYGYEMQGYWCDIGSIGQYMQAQRDMLDGRLSFETTAQRSGNVFIEPGANVSDNAAIRGACYISAGCEIGERVSIDPYTVIGSNVKVEHDSSLKRSVIMPNTVVREKVQLRGCVLCNDVQIGTGCSVFEGSVVGEGTTLGENCTVYNEAGIWPKKDIEPNTRIEENIVWGIGKRIVHGDDGIKGYCDTDISPETTVRIGTAFASLLDKKGGIAVATDGTPQATMLKRAFTAGVVSQGVDVYSMPQMPYTVLQFAIRHMGLSGGTYIKTNSRNGRIANVILLDSNGTAIDTSWQRKVNRQYAQGELLPVTSSEIGVVMDVTGTVKSYEAELLAGTDTERMAKNFSLVLIDAPAAIYEIAALAIMRAGFTVERVDSQYGEKLYAEIVGRKAALGFWFGNEWSVLAMLGDGRTIAGDELTALFCRFAMYKGRQNEFYLPVSFPDEYTRFLMNEGAKIESAPEAFHRWQQICIKSGTAMPEFFDSVAACLRLCEMQAYGVLTEFLNDLPRTYRKEQSITCSWDSVGRVLRTLADDETGAVDAYDGVKIHRDDGWVLVKAGDRIASCRLICGSFNEEYAKELSRLYLDKITSTLGKEV